MLLVVRCDFIEILLGDVLLITPPARLDLRSDFFRARMQNSGDFRFSDVCFHQFEHGLKKLEFSSRQVRLGKNHAFHKAVVSDELLSK